MSRLHAITPFLWLIALSTIGCASELPPPEIKGVYATTELKKHVTANLVDGTNASWCEGTKAKSTTQYIELSLQQKALVKELYIRNGFGVKKHFKANNRIKILDINGQKVRLKDTNSQQRIALSEPIKTDKLKLKIKKIYKGKKWDDTCITEISFTKKRISKKPIASSENLPEKVQSGMHFFYLAPGGKVKKYSIAAQCDIKFVKGTWEKQGDAYMVEYTYRDDLCCDDKEGECTSPQWGPPITENQIAHVPDD